MARKKALARKISYNQARSYRRTHPNPIGVTAIASVNDKGSYERRYARTMALLGKSARKNPATADLQKFADKLQTGMSAQQREVTIRRYGEHQGYTEKQIEQVLGKKSVRKKTAATKASVRTQAKKEKKVAKKKTRRRKRGPFGTTPYQARPAGYGAAAWAQQRKQAKALHRRGSAYAQAVAKHQKELAKKATKKKATKRRASPKTEKAKAVAAIKALHPGSSASIAGLKPDQVKGLAAAWGRIQAAEVAAKKADTAKKAAKKAVGKRGVRAAASKAAKKKTVKKATTKLTPKQRAARARAAYRKRVAASRALGATPARVYGRKFPAARAKLGTAILRDTYKYESTAGTLKKIPLYAILGFRSQAQLNQHWGDGKYANEKSGHRIKKGDKYVQLTWDQWIRYRMDKIRAKRASTAASIQKRGGLFVANPRRRRKTTRALTYKQWESSMKKNRGRKRRKKTRKNATRAQIAAARRNIKKAQAARKRRRAVSNRRRKPAAMVVANKKRRATPNRKRRAVANKKRRAVANKKRRATPNRKRRAVANKKIVRRTYRRNQYVSQLKNAFKVGLIATGGYAGHRLLSRLLGKQLFAENEYKDLIAGAIVAAVGVPLTVKFIPGDAKLVGAGMMVSLLHSGLVTLANKLNPEYGGYLAGLGSYYQYYPSQLYGKNGKRSYRGYGEYFTPAMSGLGRVTQAAAGMGRITQAAAGMGQARLTQAAAGAGEYIAAGVNAIGDYEEVLPEYTRPIPVDEGIAPDLTTAEHALSVAEAAAGVGGAMGEYVSLPSQSTIEPQGVWTDMSQAPDAARGGSFVGKNGIFGS